jgi:hypothetical protein
MVYSISVALDAGAIHLGIYSSDFLPGFLADCLPDPRGTWEVPDPLETWEEPDPLGTWTWDETSWTVRSQLALITEDINYKKLKISIFI